MSTPEGSGSHNPESVKKPIDIYEKYYPKERIAELSETILEELCPESNITNIQRHVVWTDESKNRYAIEKVRRVDTLAGVTSYMHKVVVSHVAPGSQYGGTTNQYVLESHAQHPREQDYQPVRQTIKDGIQLGIPITHPSVATNMLRILFEKKPDTAQRLLQDRIDIAFNEEIVGEYILSHLAVIGPGNKPQRITRNAILSAVKNHTEHIKAIERREARGSMHIYNKDNPAMHEVVLDAIETKPLDGRRGSTYLNPNLAKAAIRVAARLPDHQWSNTIHPHIS